MRPIAPVALSCGEPAGIGPDLAIEIGGTDRDYPLVALGSAAVLADRARALGRELSLEAWEDGPTAQAAGRLSIIDIPADAPVQAGKLDPGNARHVLRLLEKGTDGCTEGRFAALVTAPLHKGVINDAGIRFSGHTEFLAERTGAEQPVMMLACPGLRVALATTHLPLREVADAITADRLERVIRVLHGDLVGKFGLARPRTLVCGLNPHAGEGGHLGHEERETLIPVLERLRAEDMELTGPLPADTAFTPPRLEQADAVLAMYHDQGLPVLKYRGFGEAVNLTLGLPIIRTSVDHGTALDLAGTGRAHAGSLEAAIRQAVSLAETAR